MGGLPSPTTGGGRCVGEREARHMGCLGSREATLSRTIIYPSNKKFAAARGAVGKFDGN